MKLSVSLFLLSFVIFAFGKYSVTLEQREKSSIEFNKNKKIICTQEMIDYDNDVSKRLAETYEIHPQMPKKTIEDYKKRARCTYVNQEI